jgi:mRNA degradation ribonuclease J1/J2
MKIENRLYSVREVAILLRTGPARVRAYVQTGILTARRHGRRILILGSSLARYLEIEME